MSCPIGERPASGSRRRTYAIHAGHTRLHSRQRSRTSSHRRTVNPAYLYYPTKLVTNEFPFPADLLPKVCRNNMPKDGKIVMRVNRMQLHPRRHVKRVLQPPADNAKNNPVHNRLPQNNREKSAWTKRLQQVELLHGRLNPRLSPRLNRPKLKHLPKKFTPLVVRQPFGRI